MTLSPTLDQPKAAAQPATSIEPTDDTAVRSHQSYAAEVYAVCHHSGQYLSLTETYPQVDGWLRKQHDFPGLPTLDDAFARAAHAAHHRHREWNAPLLEGIAHVISALLLLVLLARLLPLRDQVTSAQLDFARYWGLLIIGGLGALVLLANGIRLLWQHPAIYHQRARARRLRPAIPDFPLLHATYEIEALEHVQIDLGNAPRITALEIPPAPGRIRIALTPHAICREHYRDYETSYGASEYLSAGVVALDRAGYVQFAPPDPSYDRTTGDLFPSVEYDHRIVLRAPVPPMLRDTSSTARIPVIRFNTAYTIRPDILLAEDDERRRFALSCTPRLGGYNSYMLELHFYWRSPIQQQCFLEECILKDVPPELGTINRVERGRFEPEQRHVIWRDLAFTSIPNRATTDDEWSPPVYDQILVLRVAFDRPLLAQALQITGGYRCVSDRLISGMTIDPTRIWDARGLHLAADDQRTTLEITQATIVYGNLTVLTQQFSQKHEVSYPNTINTSLAPDNCLVEKVLNAFANCGIDLRQIVQAQPRLDPTGTLQTQLHYWDIVGRHYNEEQLNSVDVHVVITGRNTIARGHADPALVGARIEVRTRYLYDPRDSTLTQATAPQSGAIENIPRDVRELRNALDRSLRSIIGSQALLDD